MSDDFWDDPEVQSNSDFINFEQGGVGTSVEGVIRVLRKGADFNDKPCPELVVGTVDGDKTVTAGQANLKRQLSELKPKQGDRIKITYTGDEKATKGTMKVFEVILNGGGSAADDSVV